MVTNLELVFTGESETSLLSEFGREEEPEVPVASVDSCAHARQ